MDLDYYAILGISKSARPDDIKKAYLQLARDNHPDLIRDPAQKAEADRKFQLITEAYNQLRDEKARREYDRTLDYMIAAGRILSMDKAKQRQAAELYEQAMAKHPASPEPCLELGALYMRSGMYLRAMRVYETAIKRFPNNADLKRKLAEAVAAEKKAPARGR